MALECFCLIYIFLLKFARLKLGDRYFYDLGLDSRTRFTPEQLQEIRKTSMARIICDNTDTIRG